MGRVASWAVRAWVAAPLMGWWPSTWLTIAQTWWWTLVSLGICAWLVGQERQCRIVEPGGWVGALLLGSAGWWLRMPGALFWASQWVLWVVAGWLIVERMGWHRLRDAVVLVAWLQVPVVIAQRFGWAAYPIHGLGLCGTMGHRALLGLLWGMACLWTPRWTSRLLLMLSWLSGSWTGAVVPTIRLLSLRWHAPQHWIAVAGMALATGLWWRDRLLARWLVWRDLGWWRVHWLTGWGLQQLPAGFEERVSLPTGTLIWPNRDLHNTWLDVLARGGLVGEALLLGLMGWALWRSLKTGTGWGWVLAVWTMSWQSVGSQPALLALALIWLLSLCNPRRADVAGA